MAKQSFATFWYGEELSPLHWACLNSFVERGHQLRVFAYQKLKLPPGAIYEDARQIIGEEEVFEFEESFSAFSNIFRYRLLLQQGGWWVDADVYCLKGDIPNCTYSWARQDEDDINGAILKFPAGDPTLGSILEESERIGRNLKVWGDLGPSLLTRYLSGREFVDHYGSTQEFYPIHWLETHLFWMPDGNELVLSRCGNSPFVHLWVSCFKAFGIDFRALAPAGSFMHHVYKQSEFYRELPPLDDAKKQETLVSINSHLNKQWVIERLGRALAYKASVTTRP